MHGVSAHRFFQLLAPRFVAPRFVTDCSAGGYLHSRGRLSPHGLAESWGEGAPHHTYSNSLRRAAPSLRCIPRETHFSHPSTRFPVGRIFLLTRRNFSSCKAHSRIRLKIQVFASWQLPCTYDHRN